MGELLSSLNFCSSDRGLVLYLHKKIHGSQLPENSQVQECDLYGDEEPWEMWETLVNKEEKEEIYIITQLKKIGRRVKRRIGSGSWVQEHAGRKITVEGISATVKRYWYDSGEQDKKNGSNFLLEEYRIEQEISSNGYDSDGADDDGEYVICRLKKEERKRGFEGQKRKLETTNRLNETIDIEISDDGEKSSCEETSSTGASGIGIMNPRNETDKSYWLADDFEVELIPNEFFSDDWVRGWKIIRK